MKPPRPLQSHSAEQRFGARQPETKVSGYRQEPLDGRFGSGLLGDPGLELARPGGEWVEVERRREPPLSPRDVQKPMIEQMIIDVRDENGNAIRRQSSSMSA
jgi:hypothetical protein